jgi:hypothetical protein
LSPRSLGKERGAPEGQDARAGRGEWRARWRAVRRGAFSREGEKAIGVTLARMGPYTEGRIGFHRGNARGRARRGWRGGARIDASGIRRIEERGRRAGR